MDAIRHALLADHFAVLCLFFGVAAFFYIRRSKK